MVRSDVVVQLEISTIPNRKLDLWLKINYHATVRSVSLSFLKQYSGTLEWENYAVNCNFCPTLRWTQRRSLIVTFKTVVVESWENTSRKIPFQVVRSRGISPLKLIRRLSSFVPFPYNFACPPSIPPSYVVFSAFTPTSISLSIHSINEFILPN